jgi:hypothetical protein
MTDREYGLGRLHAPDERDRNYLIPKRQVVRAAAGVTRRLWNIRAVLDQGNTPQCVGHAARHYLTCGPVVNKGGPDAHELYFGAQDNDEWPGRDYEGTSVRGAFKFMQKLGLVERYEWSWDAETTVAYILAHGPVQIGSNWYEQMFTPTREGYVTPGGQNAGGHAYLLIGADRERKNPDGTTGAVRLLNSWGRGWSDAGRAWLSFNHLDRLIKEDGEACVSVEKKLK